MIWLVVCKTPLCFPVKIVNKLSRVAEQTPVRSIVWLSLWRYLAVNVWPLSCNMTVTGVDVFCCIDEDRVSCIDVGSTEERLCLYIQGWLTLLVRERSALATIIFTFVSVCQDVSLSVCQSVSLSVCRSFQNASCPSILGRLSWYFNTMVPYLGKIILLHGFLIRALWRH